MNASLTPAELAHVKRSAAVLRAAVDASLPYFLACLQAQSPAARQLLPGADAERRKFNAMLLNLGSGRQFDDWEFMASRLGHRHAGYGALEEHLAPLCTALLSTVERHDPDCTPATLAAWRAVMEEYSRVMARGMEQYRRRQAEAGSVAAAPEAAGEAGTAETPGPAGGDATAEASARAAAPAAAVARTAANTGATSPSLYELVGGEAVVTAVHQRFYEELFDDPWIGIFFYGKSKESLVFKQTRFMVAAFGGPNDYRWDAPDVAHTHMYITDEQADIREVVLRNAIRAQGLSQAIEDRWLATDQSFRPALVKERLEDCQVRVPGQVPVVARKPAGYRPPLLRPRG